MCVYEIHKRACCVPGSAELRCAGYTWMHFMAITNKKHAAQPLYAQARCQIEHKIDSVMVE